MRQLQALAAILVVIWWVVFVVAFVGHVIDRRRNR